MEVYVVRNTEEEYDDVYFNIETADDVTGHDEAFYPANLKTDDLNSNNLDQLKDEVKGLVDKRVKDTDYTEIDISFIDDDDDLENFVGGLNDNIKTYVEVNDSLKELEE